MKKLSFLTLFPFFLFGSISEDEIGIELGYSEINIRVGSDEVTLNGESFGVFLNKNLLSSNDGGRGLDFEFSFYHTPSMDSNGVGDVDFTYLTGKLRPYLNLGGDFHFLNIGYGNVEFGFNGFGTTFSEDDDSLTLGWGHQFNFEKFYVLPEIDFFDTDGVEGFRFQTCAAIKISDGYDLNFNYDFFNPDSVEIIETVSLDYHNFSIGITKKF
jgi:hypothetical protein